MELWKPIDSRYEVSNWGRVKRLEHVVITSTGKDRTYPEKILNTPVNKKGYVTVALYRQMYSVHRLVAQAFIHNPDNKPEVNHKDLDKTNNNDWNLEWMTHSENMQHANIKQEGIKMSIQRLHAFEKTSIQARHTIKRLEAVIDSPRSTDAEKKIAKFMLAKFQEIRDEIPENFQDVDLKDKE